MATSKPTSKYLIDDFIVPIQDGHWSFRKEYILGAEIVDSPVRVYRELTVPSDLRLGYLGELLIRAFGWAGHHLSSFTVGELTYATPYEILERQSRGFTEPVPEKDSMGVKLSGILPEVGSHISFIYDFGDHWVHDVYLKEIKEYKNEWDKKEPPMDLIFAQGACPPEDCGGVHGYEDLLRIIADPKDPEHKRMKTWLHSLCGEGFRPDAFDIHGANLRIWDFLRTIEAARLEQFSSKINLAANGLDIKDL